jgi:hypothetical protein
MILAPVVAAQSAGDSRGAATFVSGCGALILPFDRKPHGFAKKNGAIAP